MTREEDKTAPDDAVEPLRRFAAHLSHRIRNPLSAIWNVLYHLKKQFPSDGDQGELLRIIEEEVYHFKVIGDELDLVAKPRKGSPTRVPLGVLFAELRGAVSRECAPAQEDRIDVRIADPDATVALDQRFLVAALKVLVFHVASRLDESEKIAIDAGKDGARLRVLFKAVPRAQFDIKEGQLRALLGADRGGAAGVSPLSMIQHAIGEHGGSLALVNAREDRADLLLDLPAEEEPSPDDPGSSRPSIF